MSNTKLITLDNLTRAVRQIEAELPDAITDEQIEEILETDTTPTLVGPSGVTVSQILNMVYPVGSYYISNNNTSPAQLFGGMWERVQGKFLLGASDNGETGTSLQSTANVAVGSSGGEAAHTLVENELPAIDGALYIGNGGGGASGGGYGAFRPTNTSGSDHVELLTAMQYGCYANPTTLPSGAGTSYSTARFSFGNDGSHNNMPPFIAAYIWYRIS